MKTRPFILYAGICLLCNCYTQVQLPDFDFISVKEGDYDPLVLPFPLPPAPTPGPEPIPPLPPPIIETAPAPVETPVESEKQTQRPFERRREMSETRKPAPRDVLPPADGSGKNDAHHGTRRVSAFAPVTDPAQKQKIEQDLRQLVTGYLAQNKTEPVIKHRNLQTSIEQILHPVTLPMDQPSRIVPLPERQIVDATWFRPNSVETQEEIIAKPLQTIISSLSGYSEPSFTVPSAENTSRRLISRSEYEPSDHSSYLDHTSSVSSSAVSENYRTPLSSHVSSDEGPASNSTVSRPERSEASVQYHVGRRH